MVYNKSLDQLRLIETMLADIQRMSSDHVFSTRALRLTCQKLGARYAAEGMGFLTKTLPALGKALDKCLAGGPRLVASELGFEPISSVNVLPKFLGEHFSRICDNAGYLLADADVNSVRVIRQICFCFYKYELPYTYEQEQQVLERFKRTEQELLDNSKYLQSLQTSVERRIHDRRRRKAVDIVDVARNARILLAQVLAQFDPRNIVPRHGPGAVSTREILWEKYHWTNVSWRIRKMYPLDEYFFVNLGHVADRLQTLYGIGDEDLPARVILVPKDSRGPRLISCEPVDFQWIQQGIARSLVKLVESHPLTKDSVRFTDQQPNALAALAASANGRYATLDLNEASDRVSLDLVRLLFPPHICEYLEAARSSSTELPNFEQIKLRKFAPMGSSLCFPIMALTIWALLAGMTSDREFREKLYVYGDDVIVPTEHSENAIRVLEAFGLKANRDKCCVQGLFRESCGMDAFKGSDVTPVRFRTVWSTSPSPEAYESWIAYANQLYKLGYTKSYEFITRKLFRIYGSIPSWADNILSAPSLVRVPSIHRPRTRWNKYLQRYESHVLCSKPRRVTKEIDGWAMLLRFFAESAWCPSDGNPSRDQQQSLFELADGLRVSSYTHRRSSMLVRRWR